MLSPSASPFAFPTIVPHTTLFAPSEPQTMLVLQTMFEGPIFWPMTRLLQTMLEPHTTLVPQTMLSPSVSTELDQTMFVPQTMLLLQTMLFALSACLPNTVVP